MVHILRLTSKSNLFAHASRIDGFIYRHVIGITKDYSGKYTMKLVQTN